VSLLPVSYRHGYRYRITLQSIGILVSVTWWYHSFSNFHWNAFNICFMAFIASLFINAHFSALFTSAAVCIAWLSSWWWVVIATAPEWQPREQPVVDRAARWSAGWGALAQGGRRWRHQDGKRSVCRCTCSVWCLASRQDVNYRCPQKKQSQLFF